MSSVKELKALQERWRDDYAAHPDPTATEEAYSLGRCKSADELQPIIDAMEQECEWKYEVHAFGKGSPGHTTGCGSVVRPDANMARPCWCGRKVKVVEDE